jgi:hypothetical protein
MPGSSGCRANHIAEHDPQRLPGITGQGNSLQKATAPLIDDGVGLAFRYVGIEAIAFKINIFGKKSGSYHLIVQPKKR